MDHAKIFRMACTALFCFGSVALVATRSNAQEATDSYLNGAEFGDWQLSCEALTTTELTCSVVQQLTRTADGSLIARLVVINGADEGQFLLVGQTPDGVHLPSGFVYSFDDEEIAETRDLVWQQCLAGVCEAALIWDAEELAVVNQYDNLLMAYRQAPGVDPLVFRVDVSELDSALVALATTRR